MAGSTYPEGPGWWQASDGQFYPPPNPAVPAMPQFAPSPQPPYMPGGVPEKGFFGSLFDLSFSKFITPGIIKALFVLAIAVWSLYRLVLLVAISRGDGDLVVLGIIIPILWLLGVIYSRVMLEVIMVLFAIEKNTRDKR